MKEVLSLSLHSLLPFFRLRKAIADSGTHSQWVIMKTTAAICLTLKPELFPLRWVDYTVTTGQSCEILVNPLQKVSGTTCNCNHGNCCPEGTEEKISPWSGIQGIPTDIYNG